ncbi:MAG: putative RNA-binding protein with PUA-like domain [Candidatus Azotimanducaceae bacterium]
MRNYQARNFLRDDMKIGDLVLFYHSNTNSPGVAGIAQVASQSYPDPTAFDKKSKYYDPKSDPENPRWMFVDVSYTADIKRQVPLEEMKSMPELAEMRALQQGNRLSIMPVTKAGFQAIKKAGGRKS